MIGGYVSYEQGHIVMRVNISGTYPVKEHDLVGI